MAIALLAVAMLLAGGLPASAQRRSCTISVNGVNFGTYNVFNGSPTTSTGAIVLECRAVFVLVTLGPSQKGGFTPRAMSKGSESLEYNLYQDATHTTVWGDWTAGTAGYFRLFPPDHLSLPIYGRIPPGQDVTAGMYSDSVTAVVNF